MKKSLHTYYKVLIYSWLRKFKIFTSVHHTLIKTLYSNELQGYKLKVKIFLFDNIYAENEVCNLLENVNI